ncbi:MAG: hypothetical protein ACFFE5_16615, partial [Candidatus Thorarchaeota archaeon]
MANNIKRKYIGAICNRDLEVMESIKKFLLKNYNITLVDLMKNGIDSFNSKYLEKKLKKYPICFLIVKLTTQKNNNQVYEILNEICPDLPVLNDIKSVQICESRYHTFRTIQNNYKKIITPRLFNSKLEALRALRKDTDIIVKLDAHNIPNLPKNDRILGIAKKSSELEELINDRDENTLFLQ